MNHVLHVVGARPNFMKVAPVYQALSRRSGIRQTIVHTGQHYDDNMSKVFFTELALPTPDENLEVGSGSHAVQTAQILMRFEERVLAQRPDLVLVYGDVNSTVAAALVCAKLLIPVGHVEAGLRSFDRTMPEEINRLLTDQIADVLFTPSRDGDENLLREGVSSDKIHLVGNVMIDTLVRLLPEAEERWKRMGAVGSRRSGTRYCLVTLHRPSNVDDPPMLGAIMEALGDISHDTTVFFPVHPRTRAVLESGTVEGFRAQGSGFGSVEEGMARGLAGPSLCLLPPVGYLDFLALQMHAAVVITDSGGIQEETTYLGIPCLTLRENTERPITVTMGTNTLVGRDTALLRAEVERVLNGRGKRGAIPPLWDGRAGERIAAVIDEE